MIKKLLFLSFIMLFSMLSWGQIQTITVNSPGGYTFTTPCGVTELTIECWGAGGSGQGVTGKSAAGGGGAGGGYVKGTISVSENTTYSLSIGTGGSGSTGPDGQSTWFISNTTVNGVGGKGAGAQVAVNNGVGVGAIAYT
ncbi:MAG: hypothetical protein IT220_06160, partial [Flavobacteriaceae bacterium]|nr:hypothetical protein [Flavobacteriaceae bacterium]